MWLNDEATDAQAIDLWCSVVLPAGAERLPPAHVDMFRGGKLTPDGRRTSFMRPVLNPPCP